MILSASTIFLSAFLLFQIQPMIAKMILPWFGGSAAVWITAMLFFQTALLGGYLYAHWSVRSLGPRSQSLVHAGLLGASLLLLPVTPSLAWKPSGGEEPIVRILGLLAVSIGLPYMLLSTTSPLIQAWYARRHRSALPYRFFALSNLASLLGLLAYPFLVEPNVTLRQQSLGWSMAYGVFVLLCAIAAIAYGRNATPDTSTTTADGIDEETASSPPRTKDQIFWMVLAACASTFLLSITNHLTQNVASIPFLWVLPLCLYLLTFILTFDLEGLYHRKAWVWILASALAAMAYGLGTWNSRTPLTLVIPVFCTGLFIVCMFCHGELVKRKPAPRYLTSFYLMLSIGGALGGVLVGLIAPWVLPGYFELAIALMACAVLMLAVIDHRAWRVTVVVGWAVAAGVTVASYMYVTSYQESARAMVRNFYGGLRVTEFDEGTEDEARTMVHGTVIHGKQFTSPERHRERITYYGPDSGVGLAVKALRRSPLRVGVIGLGAGSLAAYAERGDVFRFYEINPLVERLARSEFTYLSDSRGRTEVILGDGRLSLERERGQQYDLLVVDAFSGDSIPVHLLTTQAMELYFRHLKPAGILALHITNTHLDLAPVVDALTRKLDKHAVMITNDRDEDREIYSATWALISSKPLTSPAIEEATDDLPHRPELRPWTDDYNNLFQILK
ncbi:MAG: fused MFS/spermidine synthase [Nitrospirota bacterium]